MDIQTGNPNLIYLVGFAALAIGLVLISGWWRNRMLRQFASASHAQTVGIRRPVVSTVVSAMLTGAAIVLLAIAIIDIRWGKTTREVPQKGIEVVFALDVSRSMLAEDTAPNRLERAKQQIKDMVDEMIGDRVALIVFAGEADQAVPLTSHYEDFKQVLDTVGPHSVLRGGSALGTAIEASANAFMDKTNNHRTIVLFTDGEDQESEPVKLAKQYHKEVGLRVFTVGLGDIERGSRIPDDNSRNSKYVQHEGQLVVSKLNGSILKEIATVSNGAYIPAGTKRVNMSDVYHGYVANIEQSEFETATIDTYTARFQWFAATALLLLLLESWLATRQFTERSGMTSKSPSHAAVSVMSGRKVQPFVWLLAVVAFSFCGTAAPTFAQSKSTAEKINEGNALLRQQKPAEAIQAFESIPDDGAFAEQLDYNRGVAHFRNQDIASALMLFEKTAAAANADIAARSRFNLGNCHYSNALSKINAQPDGNGEPANGQVTEAQITQAIQDLSAAINAFRSSLRINPQNDDARFNIELANRLKKELEQQQQQQQQQDQQQDQQDQQQQDQNPSEDPEDGQQNNENQQGESRQDSPNDSKPSDSEQDQEQSPGEKSDEQSDQESQQNQSASDDQNDPTDHSNTQQESESETNEQQDEGAEPQSGELTSDNAEEQPTAKEGSTPADQQEANQPRMMTKEEALKMLQSVRDRDMLRRLQRQRNQRLRRIPVEKDW